MSEAESAASTRTRKSGWSGLQVNLMNKKTKAAEKMKDWIILDNGSMLSPFVNPKLVERVRELKNTLELAMDAGMKQNNTKADVPRFGAVWHDEEAIANIFSFAGCIPHAHARKDCQVQEKSRRTVPL